MINIIKSEHVVFDYDTDHHLCCVKWVGEVPTEDFKDAIQTGIDLIEHHDGFSSILLDRKTLKEFSVESRVWLKQDFMRNEGKVLIKKVKKLAAIKAKTMLASVTTKVFSAIFQIANPDMEYRVFNNVDDAMAWLRAEQPESKETFIDRIFAMFTPAALLGPRAQHAE